MKLNEIPCKTWSELVEYVETHQIIMALSKDKRLVDAAKHVKNYGARCGAAIVCAELFMEKNNAKTAAHWAYNVYKRLAPDNELIIQMPYSLAWAGIPMKEKWVIKPEFESKEEEAGMANVLFHLAAVEFSEGGSNSDLIAATTIVKFLKDGMRKKGGIKWNSKLKE